MSFEEEFDRIVRQKTDEADFPFDEKNWEKAARMLDAGRETKVAGFGFATKALVVVLLLAGVATGIWFMTDHADADSSKSSLAVKGREQSTQSFVPAPPIAAPQQPTLKEESRAMESPAARGQNAVSTSQNKNELSLTTTPEANRVRNNAPVASPSDQPAEITMRSLSDPSLLNSMKEEGAVNSSDVAQAQDEANDGVTDLVATVTGSQKNTLPVALGEQNEQSLSDLLTAETLAQVVPAFPVIEAPEAIPAAINPLNYFDEDYYITEKYKKHYLNAEAGTAWLYGWNVNGTQDGRGFNWFGGVNYGMYLTKKADISLGLQVYNIGNMNQPFFDVAKTEFGFSSATTRTTIAVNSLYYLAVPVKFTWALDMQNSLGLGCNFGLLMDARNTMETVYSTDVATRKETVRTKGYYEGGMNPTNIQLSAFYKSSFGDRLHVNGEVTWAPLDIFKYSNSKINTANSFGLRLSVQYTLFDK